MYWQLGQFPQDLELKHTRVTETEVLRLWKEYIHLFCKMYIKNADQSCTALNAYFGSHYMVWL